MGELLSTSGMNDGRRRELKQVFRLGGNWGYILEGSVLVLEERKQGSKEARKPRLIRDCDCEVSARDLHAADDTIS